jgi:hypothetical protein
MVPEPNVPFGLYGAVVAHLATVWCRSSTFGHCGLADYCSVGAIWRVVCFAFVLLRVLCCFAIVLLRVLWRVVCFAMWHLPK